MQTTKNNDMTNTENFDYSLLDYSLPVINEFKKENQKENHISITTTQSLKHNIYSNIEVTISGIHNNENKTDVWTFDGKIMRMVFENITLDQAIIEANILINK